MQHELRIEETERQIVLLALFKLKRERPGWDRAIGEIETRLGGQLEFPKESADVGDAVAAASCRKVLMKMLHLPWELSASDRAVLGPMSNEQIAEVAVVALADGPIESVEARGVVEMLLAILSQAPYQARLFGLGEIHAWAVALGQRRMEIVELKERVARLESQLNGRG